jgi:transposase
MRGQDSKQASMFSVLSPERRVPQDHPLRPIKAMADAVLLSMSKRFDRMYSATGRPSIPPERLLKAQILMALYSVRSDRMFCEQLDYNLLFRWFLDMNADDPAFDHSSFTKNRERLLAHDTACEFFTAVVKEARARGLMSSEHFTVDGTLIEAMASLKSFRPKDENPADRDPPDDPGNPTVNFHGEKRSNQTHESTTDPEAKLARKGNNQEAKLCFSGHALMENRSGLLVDIKIAEANGTAEREVALAMLKENVVAARRSEGEVFGDRRPNDPS